jgi:hypothetical protein
MAWIVGLATREEIGTLQRRGWIVEHPSDEIQSRLCLPPSDQKLDDPDFMQPVMIYVDSDLFTIMSGQDWNTEETADAEQAT